MRCGSIHATLLHGSVNRTVVLCINYTLLHVSFIAGSPLRQTDIDVRGSVSVVGVRPIHDPVTDTPRAPRRARAATRTLGPLSCADALSLHRRFAISTSCALAAADVRLEQEAHRARY